MRPELSVFGTASAIEGPLLFLKRTIEASLNEAVEVVREGERPRLGRVAALDDEAMVVEVLEFDERARPRRHQGPLPRRTSACGARARPSRAHLQRRRATDRRRTTGRRRTCACASTGIR